MRRWRRMEEAGAAWITCYPVFTPGHAFAIVEIACAHGQTLQVAARLAADPHAVTVVACAGSCDLGMEVITRDLRDESRYVLERLAAVEGIREVRTHQAAAYYRDASQWRLGLLDADAERRLAAFAGTVGEGRPAAFGRSGDGSHRGTARGRLRARHRSAHAGGRPRGPPGREPGHRASSPNRAARSATRLALRACSIADTMAGQRHVFPALPRRQGRRHRAGAEHTARGPRGHGHRRLHTLCFTAWVPSVSHVYGLESQLATRMPHVQVADRTFVIRPVKLMGQLLDEDGRRTGTVPIDLRRSPLELA